MGGKRGVEVRGGSIRISFRFQGVRCRETLKLNPTRANLTYAENLRASILHEIQTRTFDYARHFPDSPRAAFSGRGHVVTIGQRLTAFLQASEKACSPSTFRDYRSVVEHHLRPRFGDMAMASLTTAEIRAWIAGLEVSNKRINNVLIPLRQVFEDAFDDGLVDRDPVARVRALKVQRDEPDPFTPDELRAILGACTGQELNLYRFAFWTGLRIGELIALQWGDVDLGAGVVHVRRSSTRGHVKAPKTAAGVREVILFPPAVESIKDQRQHTSLARGAVFHNPRTGAPWNRDLQVRNAFRRACERAGVAYKPVKQCRHTFASMLLSAGEDPVWVARQLGHTSPTFTMRVYARWIPSMRRDAGDKVRALIEREIT